MYSLKIKDKNNNYIEEITAWQDLSFWWELNRADGCEISFNVDDIKFDMTNLFPALSYIDIFRGERKLWSGFLSKIKGNIDDISGSLILSFKGYLSLLEKMEINPSGRIFSDVDQGTILWTLINNFQNLPNGDYGITQGNITTGRNRDRTYVGFKNIYEAFIQMTEVENGCDLEITENKILNVYASKGRRLKNIIFEYGKNITELKFNFFRKDLVNQANVIGTGEGEDLLYSVAHNIQSQMAYGLMQKSLVHPDVIIKETLTEHAKRYVEEYKNPIRLYELKTRDTVDTALRSYSPGDEIRLRVEKGYLDIDTYKRIKKLIVNVDQNEKENVGVELQ